VCVFCVCVFMFLCVLCFVYCVCECVLYFVHFVFCVLCVLCVLGVLCNLCFVFLGFWGFLGREVKLFFDFPEQECFWGSVITESYLKHRKSAFLGARGAVLGVPGGPGGAQKGSEVLLLEIKVRTTERPSSP